MEVIIAPVLGFIQLDIRTEVSQVCGVILQSLSKIKSFPTSPLTLGDSQSLTKVNTF